MTLSFKKLNNLFGWLVWLIATITYCFTIEPTASFWDCGEYIACAYRLEAGHPPGAPFFMLAGRLFALFGGTDPSNAAMMINGMSALSSSFSILFLFWTITLLARKVYGNKTDLLPKARQYAIIGAGLVGSLGFTFSDTFWFSAVEGEVYAMSSFFTAVVFWAILKWDEEDSYNPTGALRWLVLISYLIGISIGVHLLSLLTIPAICFAIYFKKYPFSRKGFVITGLISLATLVFVQNLIIPKIVKFVSDYEVFFTNRLHLGFSSGTILYFLLLIISLTFFILYTTQKKERYYKIAFYSALAFSIIAVVSAPSASGMLSRVLMLGGILYAIRKFKTKTNTLNAVFLSFSTLLIGYSSFFVLVIRSQANTPMDENDPENAPNMLAYLLREQYEAAPLLYGQYYNAPTRPRSEFGSGDPIYTKDKTNKNYRVLNSRKNSIPKYEKDFCTIFPRMYSNQPSHISGYKFWGDIENHHTTKASTNDYGEIEQTQVPTMAANLLFFFRYQVGYMYFRYFFWNFVGRQNDVQGSTNNNMDGNWITGIKAFDDFKLDTDSSKVIYRNKNNFANNHFFALPLLLGLMGMFFHFKHKKEDAWIVLCFFILTGLAIIVYLNQSPFQVRERDYAYVGSFYAFAIWIGFGVLYLFEAFSKKNKTIARSVSVVLLCLSIPALMAQQGWNDHDRSQRSLSRATAINYLQSCAPNAILFTNGDCDTFPLWYAQEVEGIRTDVRVVCLSLLQADWYIRQMRRTAYESKLLPFSIPEEKVEGDKMNYVVVNPNTDVPMDLKEAMKSALSDDPLKKLDNGGELLDILPVKNLYLDVDSLSIVINKVVSKSDFGRIQKRINWSLGNRSFILKNDMMILDLLTHNNWERPIYFTSASEEACVGLKDYLQSEGIAFRLVPIKQTEEEMMQGGRVNTEAMYDNIMHKFEWGGMNKPGVNLDENCLRMPANLRMQMGILANALINEGKKEKATAILNKCLYEMPDETVPFDATMYGICSSYYLLGDMERANELTKKLFAIFEGDLRVYNSQKPKRKTAYKQEINQAKNILRSLTALVQHYQQESLTHDFISRLSQLIPAEELNPQTESPPIIP